MRNPRVVVGHGSLQRNCGESPNRRTPRNGIFVLVISLIPTVELQVEIVYALRLKYWIRIGFVWDSYWIRIVFL